MSSLVASLGSTQVNASPSSKEISGLRLFSKLVCAATFFLIFMGALVTSHDAGLSVPDWPTSYGQNMFLFPPNQWIGGIFYEHVHRLVASVIGLLTLILAVWIGLKEPRRWVKILGFVALFIVCLQGTLGGLTVIYKLPAVISSAHAVLAQSFFVLTICIAYIYSGEFSQTKPRETAKLSTIFKLALSASILVYLQLIIGAFMRHTESGLAVLDFPKMAGSYLPLFDQSMLEEVNRMRRAVSLPLVSISQVFIHILHRLGALVVALAISVLFLVACFKSEPKIHLTAAALFLMMCLQFALGIYSVFSLRSPFVASAHVLCGAMLLGVSVLLTLRAYRGVR